MPRLSATFTRHFCALSSGDFVVFFSIILAFYDIKGVHYRIGLTTSLKILWRMGAMKKRSSMYLASVLRTCLSSSQGIHLDKGDIDLCQFRTTTKIIVTIIIFKKIMFKKVLKMQKQKRFVNNNLICFL